MNPVRFSLTIETMVKPVVNETVSVYNYQDDISSPIFLEEHALASWSRFVIRQRNLQKYTKRTRHNATHSSKSAVGDRRDGLLFPLATIDFDVDVLKQTSEHASQQNAANNVSNNSSTIPDDIDIPKTEPVDDNLLDWSQVT